MFGLRRGGKPCVGLVPVTWTGVLSGAHFFPEPLRLASRHSCSTLDALMCEEAIVFVDTLYNVYMINRNIVIHEAGEKMTGLH